MSCHACWQTILSKLAELNTRIDSFKTRTGLDPRSFDQIAIGVRYTYPTEGITKLVTAALARGTFSAGAMVAAGRLAANGKYREENTRARVFIFSRSMTASKCSVSSILK